MKDKEKDNPKIHVLKIFLMLIIVALIAVIVVILTSGKREEDDKTLAYTDLIKEISYSNVEKIEMTVGSTSVKVKMKKKKKRQ